MPERILIARRPPVPFEVPEPPAPYRSRRTRVIVGGVVLAAVILVIGVSLVFVARHGSGHSVLDGAVTAGSAVGAGVTGASPTTVAPTTIAVGAAAAALTAAPPATTGPPTAAVPASSTPTPASPAPAAIEPPPTIPDGSWPPIIATFDVNQVTLAGWVPSQAASDRLQALAAANSKSKAPVKNNTKIDPRAPANVGVRVVELTSARFPTGKVDILPAHAAELDRVVNIMTSAPNVTVLVIGHADQRGTSDTNFALSLARAQAVVDYLAAHGVAPERLAARAVGADEPLTQEQSEAAYALNRRTEFVFYGLLVGA